MIFALPPADSSQVSRAGVHDSGSATPSCWCFFLLLLPFTYSWPLDARGLFLFAPQALIFAVSGGNCWQARHLCPSWLASLLSAVKNPGVTLVLSSSPRWHLEPTVSPAIHLEWLPSVCVGGWRGVHTSLCLHPVLTSAAWPASLRRAALTRSHFTDL